MKLLIALFFLSTLAVAAPSGKNRILPVTKEDEAIRRDKLAQEKIKALDSKKEEDCDEKAKKPVEIVPESFSLSGNAGCTLPE
jgi:hypothetical protein